MATPTARADDDQREEFNQYLERTGLQDLINRAMTRLYEAPNKPQDPVPFICSVLTESMKEPDAAPQNVHFVEVGERTATFTWQPPPCDNQNGEITQYEFSLIGLDDWALGDFRESTTSRLDSTVFDLLPGTRYWVQIRASSIAGDGPWSEPEEFRTNGNYVGPPRLFNPQVIALQYALDDAVHEFNELRDEMTPAMAQLRQENEHLRSVIEQDHEELGDLRDQLAGAENQLNAIRDEFAHDRPVA